MGLGRTSARIARVCQLGPAMGHERFDRGFLYRRAKNGQIQPFPDIDTNRQTPNNYKPPDGDLVGA